MDIKLEKKPSKIIAVLLCTVMLLGAFIAGGYYTDNANAATGNLSSSEGLWFGDSADDGATITVKQAGKYRFNVTGGSSSWGCTNVNHSSGISTGGDITGICTLSYGDVLRVKIFDGGAGAVYNSSKGNDGGAAIMIYLNDEPLIGAGGAGGAQRRNTVYSSGHSCTYTGEDVTKLDNATFSSGGGGGFYYERSKDYIYLSGSAGNTIEGLTAATGRSGGSGVAGSNYMNQEIMNYVEMPNGSTAVSFTVTYVKATTDDATQAEFDTAMYLGEISETLKEMNSTFKNEFGEETEEISMSNIPTINVVYGKSFYMNVSGSLKSTGTFENGTVTIIENDINDNFVLVSGKLMQTGPISLIFNGTTVSFNVIEEPNSTNISVVLQ